MAWPVWSKITIKILKRIFLFQLRPLGSYKHEWLEPSEGHYNPLRRKIPQNSRFFRIIQAKYTKTETYLHLSKDWMCKLFAWQCGKWCLRSRAYNGTQNCCPCHGRFLRFCKWCDRNDCLLKCTFCPSIRFCNYIRNQPLCRCSSHCSDRDLGRNRPSLKK